MKLTHASGDGNIHTLNANIAKCYIDRLPALSNYFVILNACFRNVWE